MCVLVFAKTEMICLSKDKIERPETFRAKAWNAVPRKRGRP